MIFPKPLKKGDTVGIIAPASTVSDLDINACINVLNNLGYQVKLGNSIGGKHGFLSSPDEVRADDFNSMFTDDDVSGIICLRGGYGSARILPMIDWELPKKHPKFFMGYSDITAININLNQKSNLITFHGPMIHSNFLKNFDEHSLNSFLNTMNKMNAFDNPPGRELISVRSGKASGVLTGGNLTLLTSTLGTPYEVDTKNKILFIEDVGKHTFRIDRRLTQLNLAGKLNDLKGVLVGDFKNCEPKRPDEQTLDDVIKEHFGSLNIPIISNLGVGHCKPMSTLPLGATCHMDADKKDIIFEY